MFLTITVIFSLILHGKDTARTLFLQEELPALGIWPAAVRLFCSHQTLKDLFFLHLRLPDGQLEMPPLLLGPARLSAPLENQRLFTPVLQNPSFVLLIADSVVAQKHRLPTRTAFSRGSELILTQSVGTKEINLL